MPKRIAFALAAMLCVSLGLGMAGCGSKGDPGQIVKDFWDALQRGDFAAAESYLSQEVAGEVMDTLVDPTNDKAPMIVQAILNSFRLDIVESSQNGDRATVDVEMTMPDRDKMSGELMDSVYESMGDAGNLSEEEYMQMLTSALTASLKKYPAASEPGTVNLVWQDDTWKIDELLWGDVHEYYWSLDEL